MERKKRTVIAEKKRINFNNPNLGKITPIAEYLEDHYESLDKENFCETNEIYVSLLLQKAPGYETIYHTSCSFLTKQFHRV